MGKMMALAFCLLTAIFAPAQDEPQSTRAMRPVIRGRQYAVSSMRPEATRAAMRILEAGGNGFDAIVAGQAALAIADAAMNGLGSDAVILVYDAKAKKVVSIDAEGTAPKLATIDWYKKNNGGRLPVNDGLLSATVPGVIDAWYILLDRWGTMNFAQVLEQAIDMAENGFPIGDSLAGAIASAKKLRKYPTSMKVYLPNGEAPKPGDIFKNPDLARTLKKLVEAEKQNASKGRREALKAARDRFYKGDIAQTFASSPRKTAGCSATRISPPMPLRLRSRFRSTTAAIRSTRTRRPARGRRSFSRSIFWRDSISRPWGSTASNICTPASRR